MMMMMLAVVVTVQLPQLVIRKLLHSFILLFYHWVSVLIGLLA